MLFDEKVLVRSANLLHSVNTETSFDCLSIRVDLNVLVAEEFGRRRSVLQKTKELAASCWIVLSALLKFEGFWKRRKISFDSKYILVADHNREAFINLITSLSLAIDESPIIVTSSMAVKKRLSIRQHQTVYIQRFAFLRWSEVVEVFGLFKRLSIWQSEETAYFKLALFFLLLRAKATANAYSKFAIAPDTRLLTLCDAHMNEYLATKYVKDMGGVCFTLQHGVINPLYLPVVSDFFLVWSQAEYEELKKLDVLQLGIQHSKILVCGNPLLKAVVKDYVLDNSGLKSVCFYASNWDEHTNFLLLNEFLKLKDLPGLSLEVRLRPNTSPEKLRSYREHIKSTAPLCRVSDSSTDSVEEVLLRNDLAVTHNSGVAVDAIVSAIPCILLDIVDEAPLVDLVRHYHHCTVVSEAGALNSLAQNLTEDVTLWQQLTANAVATKRFYQHCDQNEALQNVATAYQLTSMH